MYSPNVIHHTLKLLKRNFSNYNVEMLLSKENKKKTLESFKKLTKIKYGRKVPSRHAAVLVPICVSDSNEISILYTLRSSKLRTHKSQVSFPGELYHVTLLFHDIVDLIIQFMCTLLAASGFE
jgi:hypothetical protein